MVKYQNRQGAKMVKMLNPTGPEIYAIGKNDKAKKIDKEQIGKKG